MTERSVKLFMLGAAITAVTILTMLAVAGLVITSRGPQAQALPLARTSIAEVLPAEVAPETHPWVATVNGPEPTQSPQLTTSSTEELVAALYETAETGGNARTSYRSSRVSQPSQRTGPAYPPLSLPPTSVRTPTTTAVTPPVTTGIAPPSTGVRTLTSNGTNNNTRESTTKTRASATTAPLTTTTTAVSQPTDPANADTHTHEIVPPLLRESDDDDDEHQRS